MSIHNIYNEECLTCASYQLHELGDRMCDRLNDPRTIGCPCGKCLIKSMCEHGCPDYYDFWNAEFISDIDKMREGNIG